MNPLNQARCMSQEEQKEPDLMTAPASDMLHSLTGGFPPFPFHQGYSTLGHPHKSAPKCHPAQSQRRCYGEILIPVRYVVVMVTMSGSESPSISISTS